MGSGVPGQKPASVLDPGALSFHAGPLNSVFTGNTECKLFLLLFCVLIFLAAWSESYDQTLAFSF